MALILILDDRATNRSIYARLATLISEDVVVESFGDPLDALEWLADNPVDLVITDYKMPGMNGAEFTRRVRAMPHGADTPIIVVTAYDDRSFRLHAMEAGATDFLQSPVDHFEFVARARNLLALQRGGAEPAGAAVLGPGIAPSLEDLPALVTVTDPHGRCLFVNLRQARLAGGSPEGLLGQDIAQVLGPERAALSRRMDQQVLATGRALQAYREHVPGTNGPMTLVTAKGPLRNASGDIVGVVSTSVELAAGDAEAAPPLETGP